MEEGNALEEPAYLLRPELNLSSSDDLELHPALDTVPTRIDIWNAPRSHPGFDPLPMTAPDMLLQVIPEI